MKPAEIISLQRDFFDKHKPIPVSLRKQKLQALKKCILQYEKQIYAALQEDLNKSEFETLASELGVVMRELTLHIKNIRSWAKPKKVFPSLLNFPSKARIYKQAYGNVLIIAPWNYPFNLSMIPLISAVAAGNTAVLKPSEYAPHTAQLLTKIISEVFPPEYVQVIQGDAQVAQALLKEKWNYIFFTGSPAVGKYVYRAAAEKMTPVTLELGGKSPVVIDETANLPLAAKRIVWGKFLNAGQTCIAPDYVLLPKEKLETFIDLLRKEIRLAYGDNPIVSKEYVSIINQTNFDRLLHLIQSQEQVEGGTYDVDTLKIAPTLVINPSLDSELMQYEIFGPVLPLITYAKRTEMEQILQMHPHPLAFYVFSKDTSFQHKMITQYSFGGGVINDVVAHFVNHRLPFGGVGGSGTGAYHGKYGFDTFTHQKSVVKRALWWDVPIRYLPVTVFKKKVLRWMMLR